MEFNVVRDKLKNRPVFTSFGEERLLNVYSYNGMNNEN